MKSFDYTADDNDILTPQPSLLARIRSRIHFPRLRKKMPDALSGEEPPLTEQEAAELKDMIESDELKQMVDSLKNPNVKQFAIPKIVIDTATPEPALPIPTPRPPKPWIRFANTIIGILALIGGLYGVMVLYNQFPTYPSIIIGIVAVSASAGVITGISTRG
jgi:hypothetical protein